MEKRMSYVGEKENKEGAEGPVERRKSASLDYDSIHRAIETNIDTEVVEDAGISLKIPDASRACVADASPFTFKDAPKIEEASDSNYQCCEESLPTLHDLVSHYEKYHYNVTPVDDSKEGLQYVKSHGGDSHNEVVYMPSVVFNDMSITYDYSKPTMFYNTILQSESLSLGVLLPPVVVKDFNMDAETEMLGESQYEDEDKKRPFKCTHIGCNKKYTSAYGLKYHMSKGHIGGGMESEKPYSCDVPGCGKRYKNANGLKYHFNNGH